ncbi:two-component regulator propeller domain-containing protein [Spirosoma sp. KUDC1026]|uniref:type IX secretion system anionic LPS delivery protein PorZ n=1 Tax=Spirosoma sp. KUDC1026 TaxID=2745947 RepID=UPI00159BB3D3|nr:two-component regulator propeller domain-containing protein [Spirosoma sp. KUDC1026]QKZ11705.1 T9SS type A sorting domain-containing protein [Spirosoma sp. KUDC1026]
MSATSKKRNRSDQLFAWLLALVFALSQQIDTQAQIGSWQPLVSYQSGQAVAVVGDKVYTATVNGFFYYDMTSGETTILGKEDGFSDVGISSLLYLADQNRLLIGYRSGNLDFIRLSGTNTPERITNINTIPNSTNLPTSRTINHMNRVGNAVYLSTDFGVVLLDIIQDEIRDTYISQRTDGLANRIYQTAATADSLYARTGTADSTATYQLRAIRLSSTVNFADPANWRPISVPGPQTESIVTYQGRVLAAANGRGTFERRAGNWVLTQSLASSPIRIFVSGPNLIINTLNRVQLSSGNQLTSPLLSGAARQAQTDGTTIWLADEQQGLLIARQAGVSRIAPTGPIQDQFANLYTYPNTLVALPNSPTDQTAPTLSRPALESFYVSDNQWQPVANSQLVNSANSAAYLPNEQRLYIGTYGGGLWSQTAGQPLTPVTLPGTISPYITSLSADAVGNLWIATFEGRRPVLHVREVDGQFKTFTALTQLTILNIVPDDNGFVWLQLEPGRGILVFDPLTNRSRYLTTLQNQGGLLTNSVRALVKDRTGLIWVGTDLGPTVFDNPAGVFNAQINAQPPLLNGRRLLANETVTALAVDGGNRKWIGTLNGLYQVSADGSQLVNTFTAGNSPLPVNPIDALAVEPVSGNVFIKTSKGITTYRGAATEPAEQLSTAVIFPNPVRPDFTGTVGIRGLTDNATVKILDAGGLLVYQTRSQGGTATWDLRDYRGRSAQTGIYLVVVVTADGLEGLAGKLAVVR